MRILYLFPQFPWPPDSGGKIVTYHMLRHMAKNHQITLWTFAQDRRDYQNLSHLKSYCDRIELFPARRRLQPVALVRALFGKLPYKALRWHDRGVAARLRELLAREHYDIIHAQNLTTAQYLTGRESGATLYYKENLEALILSRYAEVVRLAPLRWLLRREAAKTLRLELHLAQLCDQLVVISDADGARLCEMDPSLSPAHVPAGVDVEYFQPEYKLQFASRQAEASTPQPGEGEPEPATVLFTGSLYYYPNQDAILFFMQSIWPKLREAMPDARFIIAGQKPSRMIRALAEQPGVEVHADVPDMRPLFARATVYAVPLRVGGGMRLKILEAMAMGKAVVSTTLGAEGLEYTPGRQLLPADDAEIFAAQVVRLCRNAEARQSLEREARDWVVRHYTWDAVMGRLEKVYQDMEYNAHFLRKTSARVR